MNDSIDEQGPLIAILGAGRGSRFGGDKLDADCGGRRLGRWIVERVEQAGGAPGIIVTAPRRAVFAQEAEATGWTLVENPDAAAGIGTSVATAARHADAVGARSLILLLADMPLVSSPMIAALLAAPEAAVTATRHEGGRPGVPARFPASLFERLSALTGDKGAGGLLASTPAIRLIEPTSQALFDVDDAEALTFAAAALDTGQ